MDQFLFKNGDKVRDTITGIEAVITSSTCYLHGPPRYWVQPLATYDGRPAECVWMDEGQLEGV